MYDQLDFRGKTDSPALEGVDRQRRGIWITAAVFTAVSIALGILSQVDYVAFHLITEVAVVVVLATMFTLAWRTQKLSSNGYLTFWGMAALPVAVVTVLHALTYRGMPAFPGHTPDMPTQLWLVARYLTVAAFLVAPAFVARRLAHASIALVFFSTATAGLVALVVLGVFPTAFVEGSGLTSFKIASEYGIIAGFAVALGLLWTQRAKLARVVFDLLLWSIITAIVAELLFTTYTDVYGVTNALGHLAYLLSFCLLYLALVDAALRRPYEVLFRELSARELALRESHRFSEGLNEIDRAIHSTLDPEQILERVIARAASIVGADAAVLGLFEGDRFRPRYFSGYSGREFRSLTLNRDIGRQIYRAWELGRPLSIVDTAGDPGVSRELVEATGVRAILVTVLAVRDKPIGGLGFHWLRAPHEASAGEIDFARKLTATLGLALDNAHNFANEHAIAEALQTNMGSAAQDMRGVEVGHIYAPAPGPGRIGGDFYDVFQIDDHRLAFLLGDVVGHGLEAASKNAMVRSTVRALAYVDPEPGTVLSRAGEALTRQLRGSEFVTAVYGLLDLSTGEVTIAVAGHPYPIVPGRPELAPPGTTRGTPLGVPFAAARDSWTSWAFSLAAGETLVLFTDGVYEARRGDEFFGEERLREAIEGSARSMRGQDVADQVFAAVRRFTHGDTSDDMAILVITYQGPRHEQKPQDARAPLTASRVAPSAAPHSSENASTPS
jgi:Membrane-associated sensor domain/Stage II sporulation protein E (SpoIIE)/GAF domain